MKKDELPKLITVIFDETFPLELVAGYSQSGFMGMCEAVQKNGSRMLLLRPNEEEYPELKAQLEEFVFEKALTFVEQFV